VSRNRDTVAGPRPDERPGWRSHRRVLPFAIYYLCLFFLFLLLLRAHDGIEVGSGVMLDRAVLTRFSASEPTVGTTVSLPHHCPVGLSGHHCAATYRFNYDHARSGNGMVSVYLPLFSGSVRILLNGTLLSDSRWMRVSYPPSVSGPQLVPLPAPLLRDGHNDIDFELETRTINSAFLGAVHVGADADLRRHYNVNHFLTISLPQLIDGWQIGMGLVVLLIWAVRPSDRAYLLFGIILLCHAALSISTFPVNAGYESWSRMASILRLFGGTLSFPFLCLLVGRQPPVPVKLFVILGGVILLCGAVLPIGLFGLMVKIVFLPIMVLFGAVGVLILVHAAAVDRNVAALLMIGPVLIAIFLSIHDHTILANVGGGRSVMLNRYPGPILMAAVGCILMWRFARILALQERFNAELQQAVAATEDKLRLSFRRERHATRRAALETERVRLMGDLHDGIAGQLVSILSLCELHGDPSDGIAQATRQALVDLRLVVASLEDVGDDLGMMLGLFRERIDSQTRLCGIALDWRMEPLPDLPGLNSTATLTIFRILQEALNNAVRHSGCSAVEVRAGRSPVPGCGVRLAVRDFGSGGAVEGRGGFGLRNLRRRAETLGATLVIDSGSHGTTVTLDLPDRLSGPSVGID
jgi:signal transduction histidine kinase